MAEVQSSSRAPLPEGDAPKSLSPSLVVPAFSARAAAECVSSVLERELKERSIELARYLNLLIWRGCIRGPILVVHQGVELDSPYQVAQRCRLISHSESSEPEFWCRAGDFFLFHHAFPELLTCRKSKERLSATDFRQAYPLDRHAQPSYEQAAKEGGSDQADPGVLLKLSARLGEIAEVLPLARDAVLKVAV